MNTSKVLKFLEEFVRNLLFREFHNEFSQIQIPSKSSSTNLLRMYSITSKILSEITSKVFAAITDKNTNLF